MTTNDTRPIGPAVAALGILVVLGGCATNTGDCDPPCSDPLICCNGTCVNPNTNTSHCGECGNACPTGAPCLSGTCAEMCGSVQCEAGETCCNEVCTDTSEDELNCGECGTECEMDEACIDSVCEQAVCSPECDTGEVCCPGVGGADADCVDLETDEDNCGACGRECVGEEQCVAGVCTTAVCDPPCGEDPYRCCGGTCVNTDTDIDNCGFCGNACDPERADSCTGGTCSCGGVSQCSSGQMCCPGVGCRNTSSDPNNCGGCGVECDAGMSCTEGECTCGGVTCADHESCCSGSCRDTQSDAEHCGSCGHACGANGPACVEGLCKCGDEDPCSTCGFFICTTLEPPGPYDQCQICCPGRGCVATSDSDCGACGTECGTGEWCEQIGIFACNWDCTTIPGDAITDPGVDVPWDGSDIPGDIPPEG